MAAAHFAELARLAPALHALQRGEEWHDAVRAVARGHWRASNSLRAARALHGSAPDEPPDSDGSDSTCGSSRSSASSDGSSHSSSSAGEEDALVCCHSSDEDSPVSQRYLERLTQRAQAQNLALEPALAAELLARGPGWLEEALRAPLRGDLWCKLSEEQGLPVQLRMALHALPCEGLDPVDEVGLLVTWLTRHVAVADATLLVDNV